MKLVGSRQEAEVREELNKGHRFLFENSDGSRLLKPLKEIYPQMRTAYVIDWVPEQGEDIFDVLVDLNAIVSIELDRINTEAPPIIHYHSVREYEKKLKKARLIKLAVALDMAAKDIEIGRVALFKFSATVTQSH